MKAAPLYKTLYVIDNFSELNVIRRQISRRYALFGFLDFYFETYYSKNVSFQYGKNAIVTVNCSIMPARLLVHGTVDVYECRPVRGHMLESSGTIILTREALFDDIDVI